MSSSLSDLYALIKSDIDELQQIRQSFHGTGLTKLGFEVKKRVLQEQLIELKNKYKQDRDAVLRQIEENDANAQLLEDTLDEQ